MADSIMSKAATMEIPINSNGDTGALPEDDSLEQVSHLSNLSPSMKFISRQQHSTCQNTVHCLVFLWMYLALYVTY